MQNKKQEIEIFIIDFGLKKKQVSTFFRIPSSILCDANFYYLKARLATVFSTVSEITAFEALHILNRQVDVITPNGLNIERFTALHTFQNLHARFKNKISNFVRGHFYGFYDFDIDKVCSTFSFLFSFYMIVFTNDYYQTLYFFTAGRYEYFNKGVNLFLDALEKLNETLKRDNSDVTIVAFIIMPDETNNCK